MPVDSGITQKQQRLTTLLGRVAVLQRLFDQINIAGGRNVNVAGEPRKGFTVDVDCRDCDQDQGGDQKDQGGGVRGCTDPAAINFTPGATVDDGSCRYRGCTDPLATNYNPRASVDDGSCIYTNKGACCHPDGSCTFGTAAECTGTYQGDGTTCGGVTCPEKRGCTDPAADNYDPTAVIDDGSCTYTCPGVSLSCDSVSAAKSKCGFSHDGKRWLTQNTITQADNSRTFSISHYNCADGTYLDLATFTISYDVFVFQVRHFSDLDCSSLTTACGQGGFVTTNSDIQDQRAGCRDACNTGSVDITDTGSCTPASCGPPAPDFTICCDSFTCNVEVPDCGLIGLWNVSNPPTTITYDDEYTTAMLISHVEASLPPYSGMYTGGACASSRYLSSDEQTYSIQRSRPRFTYSPVGFDFDICYTERFTPAGGGGPSDTTVCLTAVAGSASTDGPELTEGSENGTTVIVDVHCVV